MWLWRQIKMGLGSLLQREAADRDLADEVAHYLDEAEAELISSGASPEEARRAVRLQYGDGLSAREDVRAYGWENTVEALFADLRFAARRLRQSPRFTMVAVLTLGVGIGSSTAIFSAVHPVLFKPLAYPNADRIFAVSDRVEDGSPLQVTFGSYRELSERSGSFDAFSVFRPWQPTMTGGEEPERLDGQRVTAGYFSILGVAPAFGPGFEASADRPGGPNVVVLSDALWRRRFESDRTVLGQQVTLDDEPYVVVGVMPSTFENVTAPLAEAWALLQYDAALPTFDGREWGHHLDMIGLLREGVDSEDALRELNGIADRPVEEFARPDWAALARGLSLRPLREATTARARPTMLALAGAVGLLLAIACVNVTILLLARGAQRQSELAMRVALGAGRGRLVRQLLTESLLLAGLGGVVGIVVARLGIAGLVALIPPDLPRVNAIALDGAALAFALGVTTLIGVLVGLIPALAPSGTELHQAMRKARATSDGRNRSAQRALVVTEVALALVLLVGAGLLLRSMQHLFGIPPGFDPSQVVVMQVHTAGFEDDNATHRFFDQALDAVQQLPGVASAALTSQLPLSGENDAYGVTLEEDAGEGVDGAAYRHVVSADYFETMGIPLLRGRQLGRQDITGATPAARICSSRPRVAGSGGHDCVTVDTASPPLVNDKRLTHASDYRQLPSSSASRTHLCSMTRSRSLFIRADRPR